MPAAVVIGGLVAIAFAFAAISAALLIGNVVINPLRAGAAAVAEVALVGGVLAWMLNELANIVQFSVAGVDALAGQAKQQAADTWNWLVYGTVAAQFYYEWQSVHWYSNNWAPIWNAATNFPALWSLVLNSIAPTVNWVASRVSGLEGLLSISVIPKLNQTAASLDVLRWGVDHVVWPAINGIGNDLAGLRQWVGQNAATHSEVASAEAQAIARAAALAAPIAAAVTAIEDSPCMKYCSPLGDLGQLLQGLEDAGLLAIMLALIEEARQNPQEVQSILRSVFVPLVDDAATTVGIHR